MRSREFITWFGDYDRYLHETGHLISAAFGKGAQRRFGSTVADGYLRQLVARWLDDLRDAPNEHLRLWMLNAELEWLLANVGEPALNYLCSRHNMEMLPRQGHKPYSVFFTELHELLSASLTDRPETTAQLYLGESSRPAA